MVSAALLFEGVVHLVGSAVLDVADRHRARFTIDADVSADHGVDHPLVLWPDYVIVGQPDDLIVS